MAQRLPFARIAAREDATDLIGVLRGLVESQQQQTTLLRDGLMAAQQTATEAMERSATPRGPKPENISDFRRLQPATFTGIEKPLEAEQWLVDMTNLLNAARVPAEDQVEVVKVQMTDVARTWWLAEEERLEKPVTWERFSESFYERFFPKTARREMEQQFINLR